MGAATGTARSELDAIGNDFRAIFFLAIFFPRTRLHAAFDEDRTSLLEILIDGISLAAEDDDVVKISLLLLFAIAIFVDTIGGDRETADVHATGERAQFRIAGEVAKEHRLVDVHSSMRF